MSTQLVPLNHPSHPRLLREARRREADELDSKVVARSGRYYLGGTIETIEDVRQRNDPKESILLSNMESNGWERIVVNTNSWKIVQPLKDGDVLLDYAPPKKSEATA